MFKDKNISNNVSKPNGAEIDICINVIEKLSNQDGLDGLVYQLDTDTVHRLQDAIIDSYHTKINQ